jgi:predicted amidohydrolase YtcJ
MQRQRSTLAVVRLLTATLTVPLTAAWTVPLQAREATVYRNGEILTMVGPTPTYAEALVERGGRIVHVGALAAAQRLAGTGGRQVNLGGATLLPGFIDAHGHFVLASHTLLNADLAGVRSIGALLERLRQHASTVPAGEWIEGNGYRVQQLAERRHPTRAELDTVSRERPVFVLDGSGHQGGD